MQTLIKRGVEMKTFIFLTWNTILLLYVSARMFIKCLECLKDVFEPKYIGQNYDAYEVADEFEDALNSGSTEEYSSVDLGSNANEDTQDFKTSFIERIERMKRELAGEDAMSDMPGVEEENREMFEYDEKEEYMPKTMVDDTNAGVEIITEEYEKQMEDRLL